MPTSIEDLTARPAGTTSRSDHTRARLLEAATATFAAMGFHGTSTRDIARAAGISPTAIYVHHRSKEELLYLIALQGHVEAAELVGRALAGSTHPATQLHRVVHDMTLYHARSPLLSRVVNHELAALSEPHREEIADYRRRITQQLRAVVEEGIARGHFAPADPQLAVAALMSMTVDISRWYRPGGVAPERMATSYADMALRVVRSA